MCPKPSVRVIAPTKSLTSNSSLAGPTKKRVAAYARVSTDNEEQLSSYEAQVNYYTQQIMENPQWTFVEVYTDEGISATSTKKRIGFNRMIADAVAGKIDLILTKSISRFARNTVDALTNIRKLRDRNVEVYFEKENIYTLDSKGEFMMTILFSLAEQESHSISTSTTWGRQRAFSDGRFSLPYKQFLGYEKGDDDRPKIVESEAKIIRDIYRLFLEGFSPSGIANKLTSEGIPSPAGKPQWYGTTILSILTNEKYKGDALLGKRVTIDFLNKRRKINEGEAPQYFVERSHTAAIDPPVFDLVQLELQKRKQKGYSSRTSHFSNKVVCRECDGFYGSKLWHSTSKYRRKIWQCNHKYQGGERCRTPHLYESQLEEIFLSAFNQRLQNKDEILKTYTEIIRQLTDTQPLEIEFARIEHEMLEQETLFEHLVHKNAMLDQTDYQRQHDAYCRAFVLRFEKYANRRGE